MGVGTDIVSIERIQGVLDRHGERFVNRVLTPAERARFARVNERVRAGHLAKRWAAKEAFSKAIGTGIHAPFTWHSITVGRDPKGKPLVLPSPDMQRHLDSIGVTGAHISLTDDAGMAFAFVVLEGDRPSSVPRPASPVSSP
ncbi:MAG TPA: holo-ACP synthase [Usitatibacter sp.]|nr:holo-ACP synthase [Usitatibacter sp.]